MKRCPTVVAALFVALLLPAAHAPAGEWEDYLESEFQNFLWDEAVRTGYEAYGAKDYEAAFKALEAAITKGCKDPVVVFRAGYARRAAGEPNKAAGYFKTATEQFATARTTHRYRPEAHYYLAEFYVKHTKYDEAEWELEHATHLRRDFTEAYLLHGDLFVAQGKHHFAAEQYQRAHQADPKSVKPLMNLAVALYRDGKLSGAKAAVEKARLLEPENERVGLMAATLDIAQNNVKAAWAEYAAIHRRDPASVDALMGLAYIAWRQGKFDTARRHYGAVLELEADHVEALYGLALAEVKLGQAGEAIEHMLKVVEIEPANKNAHYNLGSLYLNQDEHELARKQYLLVMQLDPADHTPAYNLGVIFVRLKRYPEAQDYLEQAVEAFGKDTQWGRAAQKLLDMVIQIRQDRTIEIDKEIERLGDPGTKE